VLDSSSASLILSSLELSDTKVYEPYVRALLRTASHSCEVVVLESRTASVGHTRERVGCTRMHVGHSHSVPVVRKSLSMPPLSERDSFALCSRIAPIQRLSFQASVFFCAFQIRSTGAIELKICPAPGLVVVGVSRDTGVPF